jgi:methyl-accepting chemotaxis protein
MNTKSKKSNEALHAVRQPKIRLAMLNPAESVGTKLLLTVFACIAAVVLIVGLSSYHTAKKVITERVAESTKETIVQATDKIELFLGLLEGITVQILSDETIISNLANYKNPAADQYEKMQASIAISNRLNSYALSNTSIIEINIVPLSPDSASFRSKPVDENLYQQEWFAAVKEAGGGAVWLPTRAGGYLTGLPSFAQGRVLRNLSTGRDEGILLVEIKPDALREALGHVRIGKAQAPSAKFSSC